MKIQHARRLDSVRRIVRDRSDPRRKCRQDPIFFGAFGGFDFAKRVPKLQNILRLNVDRLTAATRIVYDAPNLAAIFSLERNDVPSVADRIDRIA